MVIVHHANCADGFTAAWVANKYFTETYNKTQKFDYRPTAIRFVGGVYGVAPPRCKNQDVILLDFSYTGGALDKVLSDCRSLTILDHHKSNMEALEALEHPKLTKVFDNDRSGAKIAWDYFFPGEPAPMALNVVEDRDLWRFKFPTTKDVSAAIFSYEYTFNQWDWIMDYRNFNFLVRDGEAINRKLMKDVNELIKVNKRTMKIGGKVVPCANIPYIYSSEAGEIMGKDADFAACYWDTANSRSFSLRSRKDGGDDVSKIAQLYGGGGHANAAGFRMKIGWEGDK